MDEIEVPPYFLCPVSLEIMKDPVTLSTGITYDRESIEKWIFSEKNTTCPVTKQPLKPDSELTPNHTLRRLIQSWCTLNASRGVERIPTPQPPVTRTQIAKLLNDAKSPHLQMKCLATLRSIVSASDANKRCMEAAGAAEFLASLLHFDTAAAGEEYEDGFNYSNQFTTASDEALSILYNLRPSEDTLKSLAAKNPNLVDSLTVAMQNGSYESRAYAVMLLKSIFEVADPTQLITLKRSLFVELVQLLHDNVSYKASAAALHIMINICPLGRNKVKAVEAGAVAVLIDLLLDSSERRACEMSLVALEQLAHCADGRAELVSHGAGLAVVSKKILRISKMASKAAVRILHWVSKFSANERVLHEMLEVGVVAKLCLVLQVDSGEKTKEKAKEILRMHSRAWKNSPCVPVTLLSSYPS
ncbi:unnamed protein product [Thlaspi arvense]|uniref:U-box domain-containing protein n=1 Tax=Thlaspi arvense TaxID=13288 RepID=A0AAU9S6P5_THLAR|nr:unnamed protein product [Thlaspi arvense]